MTRLHTEIKKTKLPTYTQDSNQRDNISLSIPAGAQKQIGDMGEEGIYTRTNSTHRWNFN